MGYRPKSIETELDNVKYEQYCNSIASRLSQLVNPDDVDCKRWPWELLQNAKDTVVKRPADKRFVDVIIKYYINEQGKRELYFEHNGEQFTSKAIVGLIWKFSAEKRDEEITEDGLKRDKQSTGRFGTGFLTTHALSRTITITGSMEDIEQHKNIAVEFTLHREGPDDEEYKKGVKRTEEEAKYDHIPLGINEQLPTRFTYYLKNDQNIKAAEMGIENVRNNSAQTMLFCPTVRSITIIDEVCGKNFSVERIGTENKVGNIKITSFKEYIDGIEHVRNFVSSEIDEYNEDLSIYWRTDNRHMRIQVAVETTDSNDILPIPFETSPSVYCSLPLIGFERMTLPFYVNSNDFEPATERTSLFLNKLKRGTTYDDTINSDVVVVYNNGVNWAILERSIALFEELVNYLIESDYGKRYNLLSGLNTILKSNSWKDEELNCLASRFILPIRHMLSDKLIVNTELGYRKLNSGIKFPECSESRNRKALYDLCKAVYHNNLTVYEDNQSWLDLKWNKFTRFSPDFEEKTEDTKNPSFPAVDYNDIADYVENAKCIENLTLSLQENITKVDWLNSFYLWIENAKLQTLSEKIIVPNRKGIFCSCKPGTCLKDATDIPTSIFTFMKRINLDWDENLLMEGIMHVSLEKETKEHIVSAIKEQCKKYIESTGALNSTIISNILPLLLAKPEAEEDGRITLFYEKRTKIISILSTIMPSVVENQESTTLNLKADCWENVDAWFMKYVASTISNRGKLDVWNENTTEEEKKTNFCTANWLEDTLYFMVEKGFIHQEDISSSQDKKGLTLIPNVYGVFCPLNMLNRQGNIPDNLLDSTLALTGYDINMGLLYSGFLLSPKLNISEYRLSDWTTIYNKFFEKKENDEGDKRKKVAKYLIHLKPSSSDFLVEIRTLFDKFEKNENNSIVEISSSDNDIWKGAKTYIVDYLARSTSKLGTIDNINVHFKNNTNESPTDTEENEQALDGLEWVNDLCKLIKQNNYNIDSDLKLVPDYHGSLHISAEIIYNGLALKKYKGVNNLIDILNGDLWKFFTKKTDQDESLTSKISHEKFVYASDYNDDAPQKLFGLVDRMIAYCYSNFNSDSKNYVKSAIEILQTFFEDNKGDALSHSMLEHNEAHLKSLFPETYNMMGDMLVNLVYDRVTRERLNRINGQFSPEEQDQLVKYKDDIKKSLREFAITEDTPNGVEIKITPKPAEVEIYSPTGEIIANHRVNEIQYNGLSKEQIISFVQQAKMDVAIYLDELGYDVDFDLVKIESYSQMYGIKDSNGDKIPVVVHSYRWTGRDFDLNPFDWEYLNSSDKSMLWVVPRSGGPQCVPLCSLPMRTITIPIESQSLSNQSKLIALATVAETYSYVRFDFGTQIPVNQKNPVPFRFLPEEMKLGVESIAQICNNDIPLIQKELPYMGYNSALSYKRPIKNIAISNEGSCSSEDLNAPRKEVSGQLTSDNSDDLI